MRQNGRGDRGTPLLTLDSVGVRYPNGVVGLAPASLSLFADQITVLLGPSGAGKSTLLRALNHLVRPTEGGIAVSGIGPLEARGALRRHRRQTAMIFQQHQLIARLTALQNVLIGRLAHYPAWRTLFPFPERDRRLALDCLARVGLLDRALSRCDMLSGGQQQRVGIARALAQQPRLVLADEPVASLDPATSRRVLKLLRSICKADGIPAIISLHQLELAREFADRIIGLADGAIVFDGVPSELAAADLERIYGEPTGPAHQDEAETKVLTPKPLETLVEEMEAR